VIRIHDGINPVDRREAGASMGALVGVFGNLQASDLVATRGTDELREGTRVLAKQPARDRSTILSLSA
jgi:hypothetical protein